MEIYDHKRTDLRKQYPKYRVQLRLSTQEKSWTNPQKTLDSVMATTLDKKEAEEFFKKMKRVFE